MARAHLGVHCFLAAAKVARVSSIALFVDLKSGFYTVVRELVLQLRSSGDDLERVLASISAPPALEQALLGMIGEPAIVERFVDDEHLRALLNEAHVNTWFVVDGLPEAARAVKGSRPGCCLADFVFNIVYVCPCPRGGPCCP